MKLTEEEYSGFKKCIQEIEARTSAEVVLVVREASGSYRDIGLMSGAVVSWLFLLGAISVPAEISEFWLPLPMAFLFFGTSALVVRSRLKAWLARPKRKRAQVLRSARACFYEKKIHQTDSRTGILIYCSRLERQVCLLVDTGAEKKLIPERLRQFEMDFQKESPGGHKGRVRSLLENLRTFGVYLGNELPYVEATKSNQLDDLPEWSEEDAE